MHVILHIPLSHAIFTYALYVPPSPPPSDAPKFTDYFIISFGKQKKTKQIEQRLHMLIKITLFHKVAVSGSKRRGINFYENLWK